MYRVTAAHAQPYLGRPVICHSTYGVHTGILHEIRPDGIVLRNVRPTAAVSAPAGEQLKLEHADQPGELDATQVFWPFFFLPWLALAAIGPWGWGPYWW